MPIIFEIKVAKVIGAKYLEQYKIAVSFADGTYKTIDFEPFLFFQHHSQHDKFRQLNNFKKFKVEHGNLVWGDDWDMIFKLEDLYKGDVGLPSPRHLVEDTKSPTYIKRKQSKK